MIIFIAGTEGRGLFRIAVKHTKNLLHSAYFLNYESRIDHRVQQCNLLVDSGGYSARMHGHQVDVTKYARFLNQNKIKLAFNLDTNDPEETLQNQALLDAACPRTVIIPVYHYSDFIERKWRSLIDRYVERYHFIAIGGVAGTQMPEKGLQAFLSYVFSKTTDKIRVHGLGITRDDLMLRYPFYSVDSTSWLGPMKWGSTKRGIRPGNWLDFYTSEVPYKRRLHEELHYVMETEARITRIWKARGVDWDELDAAQRGIDRPAIEPAAEGSMELQGARQEDARRPGGEPTEERTS